MSVSTTAHLPFAALTPEQRDRVYRSIPLADGRTATIRNDIVPEPGDRTVWAVDGAIMLGDASDLGSLGLGKVVGVYTPIELDTQPRAFR